MVVFKALSLVNSVLINLPEELAYFIVFHLFLPTKMLHPPGWERWKQSRKKKRDPYFMVREDMKRAKVERRGGRGRGKRQKIVRYVRMLERPVEQGIDIKLLEKREIV